MPPPLWAATSQLTGALADPAAVGAFAYDGWTALHLAAFFGQLDATARLLEAGASLAAVSRNSLTNTPLHAAVAGGHVEVALFLIARGADADAADAGRHTPLHIAAEAGYLPVVEALLARGADPHAVDVEDKTPLSRAAARNHTAVVDAINLNEARRCQLPVSQCCQSPRSLRVPERQVLGLATGELRTTSLRSAESPSSTPGCRGRPSNFTGGRSWNMKSHFQRSEGLDACSQVRADTGRANDRPVSPL